MTTSRKAIITSLFILLTISGFSQIYFRNLVYNRKSVYLEAMGNGKYYSVNYEYLFHDYGIKQGVRGGLGVFPNFLNANRPLCITANAEYVNFWLSRYHHIEWGAGVSYRYEKYSSTYEDYDYYITEAPDYDTVVVTETHNIDTRTTGPFAVGRIGYRYQDPNGGLIIRAAWTPMMLFMNRTKTLIDGQTASATTSPLSFNFMYFGLSIGYNFW